MKTIFAIFTFGLLLIIRPQVSKANWFDKIFGYDSYEDCLLGEIKGNETQAAARLKYTACRQKFHRHQSRQRKSQNYSMFRRSTYKRSDGLGNWHFCHICKYESYNIDGYLSKIYPVLPGKKCTVKNPTPEQTSEALSDNRQPNHISFNIGQMARYYVLEKEQN